MSMQTGRSRVRLHDLSADAFISATDQAALTNLQRIPLFPLVVRKFNEWALDRLLYVQNSAEAVRCSPKQFPTLYYLMREAAEILDVPPPELYVRYDPAYNAMTAGVERTFIALHSSIIDGFTDEELLYVIGHELGHIKCGHVLYQMIGRFLIPLLQALGEVTFGIGKVAGLGLLSAFYEWLRQAEFSCDRSGLLACQDPRVAFSATMKLGSGATRFDEEMNVEAFLEQARNHAEQEGLEGAAKVLLFVFYTWRLDHPQVVFRAKALDEWIESGYFARILSGDYARVR